VEDPPTKDYENAGNNAQVSKKTLRYMRIEQ